MLHSFTCIIKPWFINHFQSWFTVLQANDPITFWRQIMVIERLNTIFWHKVNQFKTTFLRVKHGGKYIGVMYILLSNHIVIANLHTHASPSLHIQYLCKYGWRIKVGKTKPVYTSLIRDQSSCPTIAYSSIVEIFHE